MSNQLKKKYKRVGDIAISLMILVFLFPIFILIAFMIKLTSKGPIYYRWKVVGKDEKPFTSYKFRTRTTDADDHKEKFWDENEMNGTVFKMKNDPRIFLRKFSIDEVSQLFGLLEFFVLDFDMLLIFALSTLLNKLISAGSV